MLSSTRALKACVLRLLLRDSERQHTCAACAGLALEAAAGKSHQKRAPKETGLWPVQRPFMKRDQTTTSAAQRARTASSRVRFLPRDSERQRDCAA